MCGIVGYLGEQDAFPLLVKGLKRLEYRGYDSAGIAIVNETGELEHHRKKGKVDDLFEGEEVLQAQCPRCGRQWQVRRDVFEDEA